MSPVHPPVCLLRQKKERDFCIKIHLNLFFFNSLNEFKLSCIRPTLDKHLVRASFHHKEFRP